MNFNKIYPYLLVVIALGSIYLQYRMWQERKPCSCGEQQFDPIGE